jgi:hypothetical protein
LAPPDEVELLVVRNLGCENTALLAVLLLAALLLIVRAHVGNDAGESQA